MAKRSFTVGLAAFTVTLAGIAGAWGMTVVDLNSSQRVSRLVQEEAPFVRISQIQVDLTPAREALERYPALQILLPRALRIANGVSSLWK